MIGSTRDAVNNLKALGSEEAELHLKSGRSIRTHQLDLPVRTAGPSVSSPPRSRSAMNKSAMEKSVLEAISECAANKSWALSLVEEKIDKFPSQIMDLTKLSDLDFGENILHKFPSQELLKLSGLNHLRLSMNQLGQAIPRKSFGELRRLGYFLHDVEQGNKLAKVMPLRELPEPEAVALCTRGLGPCVAVMVLQQNQAIFMHVDSPGEGGIGHKSVLDVLRDHISTPDENTKVMLIGCNYGGSGTLRGVLGALQELGLDDKIVMASIGNGHTSASLDLKKRCGYCSFG